MSPSAWRRGARMALVVGAALFPVGGLGPGADQKQAVQEARLRLQAVEQLHGVQSPEAGEQAFQLSQRLFAHAQENLVEGTALARRAVAIRETSQGPEAAKTTEARELLAFWLWHGRQYDEAASVATRALLIRQRAQPLDEAGLAADLHLLADVAFVQGDFGHARQLQEQLGPLRERLFGRDSLVMALHLYRYAQLLDALHDYAAARAQITRSIAIRESSGRRDDPDLAWSLNLLGRLCIETKDWSGAQAALERARGIWEVSGNADGTDIALVLRNLGQLADARGDEARAVQLYRRVAEIRSAALGARASLMVPTLTELGSAERRSGLFAAARVSLRRALELQEEVPDEESPPSPALALELALLDRSEGRLQSALNEALEAERLSREQFRKSALGLSERETLTQARERVGGLDLAWDLATALARGGALDAPAASALVEEALRSRALVLDTMAARQRTLALHADEETTSRVEAVRNARAHLSHLLVDGDGELPEDAQATVDRTERALAARLREYGQELEGGLPGLDEVQRGLPEGSALLSYFRTDEGRGAYVASVLLPGEAPPRIVPLGEAAAVDLAVRKWNALVSRDPRAGGAATGESAYKGAARSLAERIWDPVAPLLTGADHVLVVPAGELHTVSLATLVDDRGDYLLASPLSFHYLTAERDLVGSDGRPPVAIGLLALGDPAYGGRVSALSGSRREVRDVAERWSPAEPTKVLLGRDAGESAFKALAPASGVVHVATHAFFRTTGAAEESPLRVSGLVLADGSGEDGVLTAEEVALLDLRAVRWAVLSACGTGRGVLEPGEGVLGLRRAFQIAGARTLIVSLWPVEDDATRHWMQALYASRRAGASTEAAVQAAMREALQEQRRTGGTSHPYFWGGFISLGDWR